MPTLRQNHAHSVFYTLGFWPKNGARIGNAGMSAVHRALVNKNRKPAA